MTVWSRIFGGIGLAAAATLGIVAALLAPNAAADGIPLPSVTIPPPPTLPQITLPTTPTGSGSDTGSSSNPTTSSTPASGSTATSEAGSRTTATVDGAIRLTGGAVSIPVASVKAPARLVVDWVGFAPTVIRSARQPVQAAFRIADSRGYVVRDAVVDVRSVPHGLIAAGTLRPTGLDGVVRVVLHPTARLPLRAKTRLSILVRAYAPGGRPTGGIAALRRVSLPIRPR